jgi:hypothetical protein
MRVDGRWHRFQDDALRPVIDAAVFSPSGVWQNITMLLDCGADRTVFDASLLSLLTPLASSQNLELAGVGGKADSKVIETRLAFVRDDGNRVTVQGQFSVFTDIASSDVSVLGRDITNNFHVIYSYPERQVVLLAQPHAYRVDSA